MSDFLFGTGKTGFVDYDEYIENLRPPKRYRCSDRMCGAEDCETCHPMNFKNGVEIPDDESINEQICTLKTPTVALTPPTPALPTDLTQ